jgi:hypothetical protein
MIIFMQTSIEDKIKRIKINGKIIAWKIFQIPSLENHYKTFSKLRKAIGLDDLTNGGFLNKADEVHFNKKILINSYVTLFPRHNFLVKFLKYLFLIQLIILFFLITIYLLNSNVLFANFSAVIVFTIIINLIILKNIEQKPYKLFKISLNNESIFCYLYTKRAIYIEKYKSGVDYLFESIIYLDSDSKTKLFLPTSNFEIMPFLNKDKWGFKKGENLFVDYIYDYVDGDIFYDMRFSDEGLALVNHNKLYGYIDKDGKSVIDFQYLIGNRFDNGYAIVVNLKKKYGVIDSQNRTVIDLKYDEIYSFNANIFVVKLNQKYGLSNTLNTIVLDINYEEIGEIFYDRSIIKIKEEDNEKYGYINSNGEIVIKPIYKYANDFVCDYAAVEMFDKYDLFSEKENLLDKEDFEFEFVGNVGNYGIINKDGNNIIPFIYEDINIYELKNFDSLNVLITASIDYKWGIIYLGSFMPKMIESLIGSHFNFREEDDILNQFENYLKINEFDNLHSFKLNNEYGFKDVNNEIVIQPLFDDCYGFKNGICIVIKNKKYGIINLKGEPIVDIMYDHIWIFEQWVLVRRANKFFYLDENGNELASI